MAMPAVMAEIRPQDSDKGGGSITLESNSKPIGAYVLLRREQESRMTSRTV